MTVRTWVGRFCVADGRVEEEGPWLGSLIRQRPDDDDDELYVLVEPLSSDAGEYAAQLVDVIAQLYGRDPLSLTGALSRSLRAAHEHLRDWNRRSLAEHQVGAGATCLAVRGADAYLAQVGPAVAYVRRRSGELRRLAADSTQRAAALGIAEEFEPRITRLSLEPGDLVLAASSQLEELAPPDHVERVLSRDADDILPEFYLLCRDKPDFALVLLCCFEPEIDQPPGFLTHDAETHDPARAAVGSAATTSKAGPAAIAETMGGSATGPAAGGAATALAIPAVEYAEASSEVDARPTHEQVKEITESTAPPRTSGVRLRGDGAAPRYRRATGAVPIPQFRIPKLAIFAALAVIAAVAVGYWAMQGALASDREERFTELVAGAREANARAQATADRGLKRQLLNEASADLDDAENIHDEDPELISLQADVSAALALLDSVYEIRDFTTVTDLAQQVTGELTVTDALVGGGNAYFLDAAGGRVLRVPVDGSAAPETILQSGDLAGFVTAARPAHITWSTQTNSLTIVDETRQAFAYVPGSGPLPLTVRGIDGIGGIDAIDASSGNLYILDLAENQVWRYFPGIGGYDSERTALLDAADLSNATELAVGQQVYVLDEELGIRRFVGQSDAPFALAGIDRPLLAPSSLSVLPGSGRIVVVDGGNKRVVVASPEGEFLQQIVSPSFTDLRAVAVDEGSNTLYALNGNTLLRAPIPVNAAPPR